MPGKTGTAFLSVYLRYILDCPNSKSLIVFQFNFCVPGTHLIKQLMSENWFMTTIL